MNKIPRWLAALIAAAIAAAGIYGYVITFDDDGSTPAPAPKPAAAVEKVDGPDADTKPDDKLIIPPAAQQVEKKVEREQAHEDLVDPQRGKDPEPAGLDPGAPLASQEWPGCATRFVARSFSARSSTVKAIAVHYTAGYNIKGLADMLGLTAYSNNLRNQVSWHFLIDREGHCFYSVPTNHKAWTISGLNSETVNIEVVGRGNEPDYAGTVGFQKLTAVVQRIGRVHNIPMQLGATDGRCHVTRRGIITHWMGGPCSGGHIDIRPYNIAAIVQRIRAGGTVNRKLEVWQRKHRISHAKLAQHCSPTPAKLADYCREQRARNRLLHRLIAREQRR